MTSTSQQNLKASISSDFRSKEVQLEVLRRGCWLTTAESGGEPVGVLTGEFGLVLALLESWAGLSKMGGVLDN